jgi:hypothetical protein
MAEPCPFDVIPLPPPPHPIPLSPALLPFSRKRETQKFCLTPRLSLQLYYIPVLALKVTGQGRRRGDHEQGVEGGGSGAGAG